MPESRFVCQSWRVENGLPQNSVTAIIQTKDGYLWIGTANGLARFDGLKFKQFGLADGLPSLTVRALLEDETGALWIGTANGLSRYSQGQFTNWTTRDGLEGDGITGLAKSTDGALWIGTTTGLSRRRTDTFDTPELPPGFSHRWVTGLLAEQAGPVWVSVPGMGLLRWNGKMFAAITNLPSEKIVSPYRMLEDREGRIWAGNVGEIFCRQTDNEWKKYGTNDGIPNVRITALSESANGTIWAGSLDEGLYYLHDETFHRVTQPNGLSDEAIQVIAEDSERNLWFGTHIGGLNRLKPRQLSICNIMEGENEVPPMFLAESRDGTVWDASPDHGFYRFDRRKEQRFIPVELVNQPSWGALLVARDDSLWWGMGSILQQWRQNQLDARLTPVYRNDVSLRGDAVRCLCEDQGEGLWIGTRSGKLLLLRNGSFTTYTNGLPRAQPTALVQSHDGTLWIGSYGGGLVRFADGHCTTFGRRQGLRSDIIRALYLDSKDHLWIGTEGGGLSCLVDGKVRTFTSEQGLENETVVQILEDDAGDMWLGTFHGIFQVRRRDLDELMSGRRTKVQPRTFGQSDGMRSEQCAMGFGSCLKTRDDLLWFSTDKGIAVIDPKVQQDSNARPLVRIQTVIVAGQAQSIPSLQTDKDQAGRTQAYALTVPAGKQRLEFQFTGLYFSAPEHVRYRYRLDGLDSDWVEEGSTRTASYGYVPPGSYKFRVSAHNGNGVWSETDTGLSVIVLPHFWEKWWFRLAAWLSGVALASGVVIAVLRRRLKLRMEALERERARIAQDMHDELGSRLTKAGMVAEMVGRNLEESSVPRRQLQTLRHTLDEMTVSMDELVWAVNPKHDTLDGLANYLIRVTQEFFAGTPMHCELNIPTDLPAVPLPAAARHNLFLAFKEALNNVAKHAGATAVVVNIQFTAGKLVLVVEDNGIGIDFADKRAGGRGLENMRNRLDAIGGYCDVKTTTNSGTSVRFELTLHE